MDFLIYIFDLCLGIYGYILYNEILHRNTFINQRRPTYIFVSGMSGEDIHDD